MDILDGEASDLPKVDTPDLERAVWTWIPDLPDWWSPTWSIEDDACYTLKTPPTARLNIKASNLGGSLTELLKSNKNHISQYNDDRKGFYQEKPEPEVRVRLGPPLNSDIFGSENPKKVEIINTRRLFLILIWCSHVDHRSVYCKQK